MTVGVAKRSLAAPGCLPDGTVVYAVGDLHGRADLLARMHALIHADAATRAARRRVLVYLGDYVSRGPDTRTVIDMVRTHPLRGFELVALRGNHEDCLLRFVDGELAAGCHWLDYGGLETLASYGIEVDDPRARTTAALAPLRERILRHLPAAHLAFFRGLPFRHVEGDYLFVHAGLRPGVPLASQEPRDLMWIRGTFLESKAAFGHVVVHGHTIALEPQVTATRIGIDTGAYKTGRLTCVVCEGDRYDLLQT